ncbi:MAG: hypothetical protein WDW38_006480 [Sanguina aurantia]
MRHICHHLHSHQRHNRVTASASRWKYIVCPSDDDGNSPSDWLARARAEARLGTQVTADQVARSIMFRFRVPHIPNLVEKEGRVHFQLRSTRELADAEHAAFDYKARVNAVTDSLNAWLVCGTICEAILDASNEDNRVSSSVDDPDTSDLIMDIRLEVRTTGPSAGEWDLR